MLRRSVDIDQLVRVAEAAVLKIYVALNSDNVFLTFWQTNVY